MKLENVLDFIQPTEFIVRSENYSDEYKTPVLTAGKTFILGKTNEDDGIYNASKDKPIILFDDFTTASKFVDFNFKVKSSACKILTPKDGVNLKYVFYAMQRIQFNASQHMRYWISKYSKCEIRYPDPKVQESIVENLDDISVAISNEKAAILCFAELIKSRFNEMFGEVEEDTKGFGLVPFKAFVDDMHIGPFGSDLKNDSFVPASEGYAMVYEQKHAIQKSMNVPTRYITEDKFHKMKHFVVGPGDILVSCRGTLGECYLIPSNAPIGIIHPSLMFIRPRKGVNAEFLLSLLERILRNQEGKGSGVKMAIRASELAQIMVINPTQNLIESYISFVEKVDKLKFVGVSWGVAVFEVGNQKQTSI